MNKTIKDALLAGQLILFFGAGASRDSKSNDRQSLPDGEELAGRIASEAGYDYQGESLHAVYSAAQRKMGARLEQLFTDRFPEYKTFRRLF